MTVKLTREQAAIIGAFTGVCCGPFEDIQKLGDEVMGCATWTHQYADEDFVRAFKSKVKPLFIEICADR